MPYEVSGLGTAVPEQYNQSYTDMAVYTSVGNEPPDDHVITVFLCNSVFSSEGFVLSTF